MGISPPDPRKYMPSNADPEHRSRRKEIESQQPFSWQTPLVLGMIGVGMAWNIEKQVQKHEERKDKEDQDRQRREDRQRRRREQDTRGGSFEPGRERRSQSHGGGYLRSSEGQNNRTGRDQYASKGPRDDRGGARHKSVDYGREPRHNDRYYESRYEPRYVDRYDDRDYVPRGRSRRDSR